MDKEMVIKVDHVSMKFNLATEQYSGFKEYVIRSLKRRYHIMILGFKRCILFRYAWRWIGINRIKWKWKEYNA